MTAAEAVAHLRERLLPALERDAEQPWNSHLRRHIEAIERVLEEVWEGGTHGHDRGRNRDGARR